MKKINPSYLTHKLAKRYTHTSFGDFLAKYENIFFISAIIPMAMIAHLVMLLAGQKITWAFVFVQFGLLLLQLLSLFVNTIASKINSYYEFDEDIYTPKKYQNN